MPNHTLRKPHREGHKLEVTLGYITRPHLKQNKQKRDWNDNQDVVDTPKLEEGCKPYKHLSSQSVCFLGTMPMKNAEESFESYLASGY